MSGGKHTEKARGIFEMFERVENLVPYCFSGDLQNQVAAAIRETDNAVRDFVEALDEPVANVAAIRSALKEAAGALDLVVKYNMGPNLAIERAWKAKTLASAALLYTPRNCDRLFVTDTTDASPEFEKTQDYREGVTLAEWLLKKAEGET